ncbi:MAG: prepilin-type N-terminal cleavage/methylation domain-containing protein [Phycisphaerales bacterium]
MSVRWSSSTTRPGSRALTLVELLVVVAIIVVLIAILVPALRAGRTAARVARCLGQMRNIQQGMFMYATDNRGLLPDVGLPHGGLGFPEQSFITTVKPYCDNALVLHSPLDDSPHWPSGQGGQGIPVPGTTNTLRVTSYGMNDYLSRTFSPAAAIDPALAADRLAKVPSPAATVMLVCMATEGEYAGSDHPHVEQWWVNQAAPNLPPVQAASQLATSAAGGQPKSFDARSNWGFVDGHVATLPFGDTYLTDQINRFDPAVAGTFSARTQGGGN